MYLCVFLKLEQTPAPKRQHSRSISTGVQGRMWEPALRGEVPRQCVWLAHLRGDLHPHSGPNPPCQELKVVSLVSLGDKCPRDCCGGGEFSHPLLDVTQKLSISVPAPGLSVPQRG